MTGHSNQRNPQGALLTVDELAAWLSTTPYSIRQRVQRRQIPFIRLGARSIRFDPAAINAWLDGQRVDVA
jgi:excisionase family DNA binding protein